MNWYYLYSIKDGKRTFQNATEAGSISEAKAEFMEWIPDDRFWRGEYVIVESVRGIHGQEVSFTR